MLAAGARPIEVIFGKTHKAWNRAPRLSVHALNTISTKVNTRQIQNNDKEKTES